MIVIFTGLLSCSSPIRETYWDGVISQDDNFGISDSYTGKLHLNIEDEEVRGETYFAITSDTSIYLLCSVEGKIENDTIYLRETGIISAATIKGEWYTKDIRLFHPEGRNDSLSGFWVAHKNPDATGSCNYSVGSAW